MKHPTPEEWSAYVFGETAAPRARELKLHLEGCEECAQEVGGWQRSLRRLDEWELPGGERRVLTLRPAVKLAMAACFLLLIGFGLGQRFSAADMRAEMRQGVAEAEARNRAQLQAVLQSLPDLVREVGAEDRQAIVAQLERLQAQNTADFVSLRRDLETVAAVTEQEIRRANMKLLQFASTTE